MGIKAFNLFLTKKGCPCFNNIPLISLHGYRLAIDGCNWIYTNMSVIYKGVVMKSINPLDDPIDRSLVLGMTYNAMVQFNIKLMNFGITPVWVWDGQPLAEKTRTREKRQEDKAKLKAEVENLALELSATPLLFRSRTTMDEFKKKLMYHNAVSSGDIEMCRNLVTGLGLPSISAPNDAEVLCSALAQEGLAIGVWSTDTDNYALGTPLMMTNFEPHRQVGAPDTPGVDITIIPVIRQHLNLTQELLRDLCILSGCDNNENIPNIGPAKSYKLLLQYGSIEAFIQNNPQLPAHMLKHVRCREILTPKASGYTHDSPQLCLDRNQFSTWSRDIIEQYGISGQYESLVEATKCLVPPKLVTFTDSGKSLLQSNDQNLSINNTDALVQSSEQKGSDREINSGRAVPAQQTAAQSRTIRLNVRSVGLSTVSVENATHQKQVVGTVDPDAELAEALKPLRLCSDTR